MISKNARMAGVFCSLAFFMCASELVSQTFSLEIPPSLILVNYDRTSIGQDEGLEAGAYVARTNNAAANWYNPAGLTRSVKSVLNANGAAYEWSNISLEGLGQTTTGSRIKSLGTFVGGLVGSPVVSSDDWRFGFSITTPIDWSPSVLDAAYVVNVPAGSGTFGYHSEIDFSEMVGAIAAGYAPGGPVRFGLSLGFSETSLKQIQSTSFRVAAPDSFTVALRSFSADGMAVDFIPALGVLVDLSDKISFGMRIVAPSMRMFGSSNISYQASLFTGTSAEDIFFRDEEARMEYKYPVEVDAGLSISFEGGQIEGDVKYHGAVSNYAIYSSSAMTHSTITDSTGKPSQIVSQFAGPMNAARSIVNVAIGGNYDLTGGLRLNVGFRSDLSPVAEGESMLFRRVDLYGGTIGLSLHGDHLAGSLGVAFSSGTSDPSVVTSGTGTQVQTSLGIKTLQLLYAISYAF